MVLDPSTSSNRVKVVDKRPKLDMKNLSIHTACGYSLECTAELAMKADIIIPFRMELDKYPK